MPKRQPKRPRLGGAIGGIMGLNAAGFNPTLENPELPVDAQVGDVSAGMTLSPPRYQTPTFSENFWTGGQAGRQVSGYNQQLLMQQLREQDALAKAKALESFKVRTAQDVENAKRTDLLNQFSQASRDRTLAGQAPLPTPIINPYENKLEYPNAISSNDSMSMLKDIMQRTKIPGAPDEALAEQSAATSGNVLKAVESKGKAQGYFNRPEILPNTVASEYDKLNLANEGSRLGNEHQQAINQAGIIPIPGVGVYKDNQLMGIQPGERSKENVIQKDPSGRITGLGDKPATPPQLVPLSNYMQANPQLKIPTPDQIPSYDPSKETPEAYKARIKALYPGL